MSDRKSILGQRIVAALIDSILFGIANAIGHFILTQIPMIGPFLASLWSLCAILGFGLRDALPVSGLDGASPGKKLLGLKAVTMDGTNCDFEASFMRNLPLMVPGFISVILGIIPVIGPFIGSALAFIAFVIIFSIEIYKLVDDPRSRRVGDTLGNTMVISLSQASEDGGGDMGAPPPPPPSQDPGPPPPPPA